MPIEYSMLQGEPSPLSACPKCGIAPFEPFLRGMVQRTERRFILFGRKRPHCCVICQACKEIVGHEGWKRGGEFFFEKRE